MATGRWAGKALVRDAILEVCGDEYVTIPEIARALKRAPRTIRDNYVRPMVAEGLLEMRHPGAPSHPEQGYRKTRAAG